MKQVNLNISTGDLRVVEVPAPDVRPGFLLVRNEASVVSTGTERSLIREGQKSLLTKAKERPDLVRRVLRKVAKEGVASALRAVQEKLAQVVALGYSSAGVVEAVGEGIADVSPGERVACAGAGYATHAEWVCVPRNLAARVPEGVAIEEAASSAIGSIALHGVRVSGAQLGETVGVIGLGLIGLLTVQILRAAGCRVVGVDLDADKVELARKTGAKAWQRSDPALAEAVAGFTGGRGLDEVLVTAAAPSPDPVRLGGDLLRDRGRLVIVGAVTVDVPRSPFYEKEISILYSRSSGPGRYDPVFEEGGVDYPVAYVRWTEQRNMEGYLALIAERRIDLSSLLAWRVPIAAAEQAYEDLLAGKRKDALSAVITYPGSQPPAARALPETRVPLAAAPLAPRDRPQGGVCPRIGVIGAGAFARGVLLPRLRRRKDCVLAGVATATPGSARSAAEQFGFRYCATRAQDVLDDAETDAVVIATRHDLHASLVAEALSRGKAVFVEKPLAIREEDLDRVEEAWKAQMDPALRASPVLVGFNRSCSPAFDLLVEAFRGRAGPLGIRYRVDPGRLPASHWTRDPQVGGGRVLGEVCHFVEFCCALVGALPSGVQAAPLGRDLAAVDESVSVLLRFPDGSMADICYWALGDPSQPKERIEVSATGVVAHLNDFRELRITRGGKERASKWPSQDKGFDREVDLFVGAIAGNASLDERWRRALGVSRIMFRIVDSLAGGRPPFVTPGQPA